MALFFENFLIGSMLFERSNPVDEAKFAPPESSANSCSLGFLPSSALSGFAFFLDRVQPQGELGFTTRYPGSAASASILLVAFFS